MLEVKDVKKTQDKSSNNEAANRFEVEFDNDKKITLKGKGEIKTLVSV